MTRVQDNVYLRTDGLPSDSIAALAAFDVKGHRLYLECFVSTACPRS